MYDVVNLYRHTDSRPSATVLFDVLREKCAYKAIVVPSFETLVPHRAALEGMWSDMLAHQLPCCGHSMTSGTPCLRFSTG
jgi:hypothetical protein